MRKPLLFAFLSGIAALALPTLAVLRVTRVASGHRSVSTRAIAALAVVWALCWAVGAQLAGEPIASTSAAALAVHEVHAVEAGLQDGARYATQLAAALRSGRKITVAVSRLKHTSPEASYQGVMLMNPGGPGGSGLGLPVYGSGVDPAKNPTVASRVIFLPR